MKIKKIFNHNYLHKHVQFNILTFVLVLALLVIGSISIAHRVQATEDESALKKVVLDAFTAPSSLVVLPNTTEDLSVPIESSAIENKRGQTKKLLTDIYDASCISCQHIKDGVDKSIAAQSKGQFRALGASIKDIEWRQIVINDNTASVTLAATLWSKVKFKDESNRQHIVTPTAGFVEIFTLNKVEGKWIITNQVQDDVSASELAVNKKSLSNQDNIPPVDNIRPSKGPQITPYKTK